MFHEYFHHCYHQDTDVTNIHSVGEVDLNDNNVEN